MKENTIYILDVTNRDGVQTSRLGLAKIEKTMINIYLNELGVYQSEIGFPTTSHEINYINANVKLADMGVLKPMVLSGWVRATEGDVDIATTNTKIRHLNLSISTSDQMIRHKLKTTREGVIKTMTAAVSRAKESGIETIGVNAEDASRTSISFLAEFSVAARTYGADRIRYCDTLGCDDPLTTYGRIKSLAKKVGMPLELHYHGDFGMAVANSLAGAKGAVDAGVDVHINTTLNGMGERAGNADMASTILGVKYASGFRDKYRLDPRIDITKTWKAAKYASYAFKVPIPINQPVVGSNVFSSSSGIHVDGLLKNRDNYELFPLEQIGREQHEIVETGRSLPIGEYSGIKGFRNKSDELKIEFKDEEDARRRLDLVRLANVLKQKPITDDELLFICNYPEIAREIMTVTP